MLTDEQIEVGLAVQHPSHGTGLVKSVGEDGSVLVEFISAGQKRFGGNLATRQLIPLEPDGLNARLLRDRSQLITWTSENPLALVAAAIVDKGGKAAPSELQGAIARLLRGVSWDNWWTRVRPLIEKSEYFRVDPRRNVILKLGLMPDQILPVPLPPTGATKKPANLDAAECQRLASQFSGGRAIPDEVTLTQFKGFLKSEEWSACAEPVLENSQFLTSAIVRNGFVSAVLKSVEDPSARSALANRLMTEVSKTWGTNNSSFGDDAQKLSRVLSEFDLADTDALPGSDPRSWADHLWLIDAFELAASIQPRSGNLTDWPPKCVLKAVAHKPALLPLMVDWVSERRPSINGLADFASVIARSMKSGHILDYARELAGSRSSSGIDAAVSLVPAGPFTSTGNALLSLLEASGPKSAAATVTEASRSFLEAGDPRTADEEELWLELYLAMASAAGSVTVGLRSTSLQVADSYFRRLIHGRSVPPGRPILAFIVETVLRRTESQRKTNTRDQSEFKRRTEELRHQLANATQENRDLKSRINELTDILTKERQSTADKERMDLLKQLATFLQRHHAVVRAIDDPGLSSRLSNEIRSASYRLGLSPFGVHGSVVSFDPAVHQPESGFQPDPEQSVVVAAPGYELESRCRTSAK